ncbi:hypothetical protein [Micromonospora carbonacea]
MTRRHDLTDAQWVVLEPLLPALENVPDWTPTINDTPYPRTTKLRSSL